MKGANTLIAHQGVVYVCNLGTNRLAKGGSGDVLAGMVGALLAQGYAPLYLIDGLKRLSFPEKTSNTLKIL